MGGGGINTGARTTFDQQAWEVEQMKRRAGVKTKRHSAGCACTTCAEARKDEDDGEPDTADAKHR